MRHFVLQSVLLHVCRNNYDLVGSSLSICYPKLDEKMGPSCLEQFLIPLLGAGHAMMPVVRWQRQPLLWLDMLELSLWGQFDVTIHVNLLFFSQTL